MPTIQTKIGKRTIFFDEAKHKFTDENGKRLKSVTTFTGVINKSEILIAWAIKLARNYLTGKLDNGEQITVLDVEEACKQHRLKKEEAADIGSQIHDWIEKFLKEGKTKVPDADERVINGIQAFLSFQSQHKFKWLESEKILYSSKYDYAGITDAIARDADGRMVLVDFKSSNGIYDEYGLQLAAYQIAYEEMTGKKIDYRLIIRFGKETGDFEFRRFEDNAKDKSAFLACVTLKNRLDEFKKAGD